MREIGGVSTKKSLVNRRSKFCLTTVPKVMLVGLPATLGL
jgi:hypothetical protein